MMSMRSILAFITVYSSCCLSGHADHAIAKASVRPQVMTPDGEGVTVRWHTSLPASSRLYIYDADMNLRRTYADSAFRDRHEVIWDGRDEQGERVEPQIYIYRIETFDGEGGAAAHDPHLQDGGRDAIVYGARWDPATGRIRFSAVSDSLVRVRVGMKDGPLLATPAEWIPVLKSDAVVTWDGWDAGRTQRFDDPANLHVNVEGITLPPNCIIVKGGEQDPEPDYLAGKWLSDALAVRGALDPREYDHASKVIDAPRESGSVQVHVEGGVNEAGVLVLDEPRAITIQVPEVDNADDLAPSYEVVYFLNRDLYKEDFITGSALTTTLDPKSFSPGNHTLTMNVIFGSARVGTQSIRFTVP